MKILLARFLSRLNWLLAVMAGLVLLLAQPAPVLGADAARLSETALKQIQALQAEKAARTPAQRKMSSHLVYALKESRRQVIAPGVGKLRVEVRFQPDGRILVDVDAAVTKNLLKEIERAGGQVVDSVPQFKSVRALVPLHRLERLADLPEVRFIQPAVEAITHTGSLNSEGDNTHAADLARITFRVNGAGVRVGVLSDSVDFLAQSQATGDLPAVTILPGQSGVPASGEGTAMLEIIHDLAPGAELFFATAFGGQARFAQNILDLRAAGCEVIVDDVFYFAESPFQDGIVAQAVNSVTADGALYFSSAGNSGNLNDGTSGTWEGDFVDGGAASAPVDAKGGNVHSFGAANFNTINRLSPYPTVLFWSDPLAASTNDYDLYILDPTGANIVSSSTTIQNGTQDPFEIAFPRSVGERIVVVKGPNAAPRFLHIDTISGRLSIPTDGNIKGHAAATNAFGVAAVDAATSFPNPFSGGAANPVETFSSDGPRRVFYHADGSAITPGDFSSSGGFVRPKPDIAAADGVKTTVVPRFNPFFGTSAAAPHAAAIAALLLSFNPNLTPEQVRMVLTNTALDIEALGFDRDSGVGIVMALQALQAAPPAVPLPNLVLVTNIIVAGNGNGIIDSNECNLLFVVLTNRGSRDATGVQVTLSTTTAGAAVGQRTATYPNIPVAGSGTNLTAFKINTGPTFVCGTPIDLTLVIKSDQVTTTNSLRLETGVAGSRLRFDNNSPVTVPDNFPPGTNSPIIVSKIAAALQKVTVSLHLSHTFDADLRLELIGPDGTTVPLSANNGGSGDNYGSSCVDAGRTTFDDAAINSITTGLAPFVGTFRPQQPLSAFVGKSGTNVNGTWQLRIADEVAIDVGTLQCWSLFLTSASCVDGGGECPEADLVIAMTDNPDPVFIGSNLVYTVTVTNLGPGSAKGVAVNHTLPGTVLFVSATPSQGSAIHSGGTVTWNIGNLDARARASMTVVVLPTTAGTIFSTATVGSNQQDFDPSNNSVTISTRVNLPAADLAVGILDAPDPVLAGGRLTYTVSVTNNGPSTASNVRLTNTLPATVVVNSISASQGTYLSASNVVIATLGSLIPGARATVVIEVTPTATGQITATAQVTAIQADPIPGNNVATAVTTVGPATDLALSMVDIPDPVVVRSNLTYIITVTNRGPSTADNVVLSSTLATNVTVVSTNTSQGTISRSANLVTANLGTLASGGGATVTIVVSPTNTGVLSASATVTGSQSDPDPNNNSATVSTVVANPIVTIVAAGATLIAESVAPANGAIEVGEAVTVELRLRNAGNVSNTNLAATLLPTGGVTAPSPATTNYGVLPPGGLPVARAFTFTASGTNGGVVVATLQLQDGGNNLGTVSFSFSLPIAIAFANTNVITIPDSGAASPYPSTLSVSGVTGVVGKVAATLVKLNHTYPDDLDILLVGPGGQKALLMSDAGGAGALVNVTVTFDSTATTPVPDVSHISGGTYRPADYEPGDTFPAPAPAGPYGASLGVFNNVNPNGVWSLYVVDDTAGDMGNIAGGWNLAITTISPVNQIADLALRVSGSPDPVLVGNQLTYTFTITNSGPDAASGVAFTNLLPGTVSLISASASQGSVTTNANMVSGVLGNLGAGATATVTIVVVPNAGGTVLNTATVTGSEIDLNSANNSATATTTANLPSVDLAVFVEAAPNPVVVGSNLTYTISVTNNGPENALNVVVTDPLPTNVNLVSAIASQGAVTTNAGRTVTGSLGTILPGNRASVTMIVKPMLAGPLTNSVMATTLSSDANLTNNTATVVTTVADPAPILVIAAATLQAENLTPPNGTVDPGETVTVAFALANVGSLDTTNLMAALVEGGGVTSPSTAQSYGVVAAGGTPVARPFTFTASGTNGGVVVATLQLQDGANNLGAVSFTFRLPTVRTFSNTVPISIPESGLATPYPSTISVSGLTGLVSKVSVTLSNLNHSFPDDVDVLLVGPAGQKVVLISDAGGGHALTNITLVFDDAAAGALPDSARINSGTYLPTDYEAGEVFPGPAPAGLSSAELAIFNGTDPNGAWSLFVVDDTPADGGSIAAGWSLEITTVNPVNSAANLAVSLVGEPATLFVGSGLTYTMTVTNFGPATATGVALTNTLPLGVVFVSASSSQGAWSQAGRLVAFELGSLEAASAASASILVSPAFAGVFSNSVVVTANEADLSLVNNSARVATTVFSPAPIRLAISAVTNNQLQLTLTAQPNFTYVMHASTNLVSWLPISTNTTAGNGTFKLIITNTAASAHQFFRAVRVIE